VDSLTETLIDRVDALVAPDRRPVLWGNPLLSTTPTSIAIRDLAERMEALEKALREVALEVQQLLDSQ
jgi:hypothetical protein